MCCDLKNFFLASSMERLEYMKVPIKYFPKDIIDRYDLTTLSTASDTVYIRVKKGMYGLKNAALLAYNHLVNNLKNDGYKPVLNCPGIWMHETRRTWFCLCVDDSGVKYFSKEDADHLLNSLRKHYTISTDWNGHNYYGLQIDWVMSTYPCLITSPGSFTSSNMQCHRIRAIRLMCTGLQLMDATHSMWQRQTKVLC